MIESEFFCSELAKLGTHFFAGVPDSLLKNFCAYITDNITSDNHIIACNEGSAVGLAVGRHLATGEVPLIYMQNSGLGNTVNPILSLADGEVYSVPLIMLIGWRGLPYKHDEPQHVKQGKVTLSLLDAMGIPYVIMAEDNEELKAQLDYCQKTIKRTSAPFAFVVKKDTFAPYTLKSKTTSDATLLREDAIKTILEDNPQSIFVSTTGMISRELFEQREQHSMDHSHDFLTVGGMGHASSIAFEIASSKKNTRVICLDGDGASLMHLGSYTTIGTRPCANLTHIVLNNGAHDSVGGQPTVAQKVDLCQIAKASGYPIVKKVATDEELKKALEEAKKSAQLSFIEVLVKKGARANLGRPTTTPKENKIALMATLLGK